MNISKEKTLCLKCIDIVFSDLVKRKLIDPESKFFTESKECVLNGSFYYLYPSIEFFNGSSKINFDFSLYLVYLHAYTHFLDYSLDSLKNNPSTETRSLQISTYLLLNYMEWLTKTYNLKIRDQFYEYYGEYTDYLIAEKKWNFPQYYLMKYGSIRNIHKKAFLSLFPLELCKEKKILPLEKLAFFKKIFVNYFSFALLADDLVDLDFDINHHCLTYPIMEYFKLKGELPHSSREMVFIIPQMVITLQKFLDNIKKYETNMKKHSSIIDNRISCIKEELKRKGIEL